MHCCDRRQRLISKRFVVSEKLKAEIGRLRNMQAGQRHKSRRLHFPLHYYKRKLEGSKWHDVHDKLLYYHNQVGCVQGHTGPRGLKCH